MQLEARDQQGSTQILPGHMLYFRWKLGIKRINVLAGWSVTLIITFHYALNK